MSQADEVRLARVKAIEAYSELEHGLIRLISFLAGTDVFVGYAIFTRIGSAHAREAIASDLHRMKFKEESTSFITSVLKAVRKLDGQRNNIIHWTMAANITPGREESYLAPTSLHRFAHGDARLRASDLREFSVEAWFVTAHINFYVLHCTHPEHFASEPSPWPDIFQRPVVYPPQSDHPLFQTYQEQKARLSS